MAELTYCFDHSLESWFIKEAEAHGCKIEDKNWKSFYFNKVYERKPVIFEGEQLDVVLVISGDIKYLDYLKFLLTEKLEKISLLNRCLDETSVECKDDYDEIGDEDDQ